jgi:pimeloyl-ACP methyl ester carboxylesterase
MRSSLRCAAVALLCLVFVPASGLSQDKFFDSNGVPIRYVEQGGGDAIVLLHGDGSTLDAWIDSGQLSNLAQDYRVIAFDARGSGKSGKPHDVKAYGREAGLDIIRLLDHLGIRRAHIIGYSMGAHTTAQLLTTHPERFISATLGGAAGRFRWTAEQTARAEQEASERERECVSRGQIYRLAPTNVPKPDEEAIKRLSAACMANPNVDRFALAARTRSWKDHPITPAQVAIVKVPTLGIVGSLDGYLTDFQELKKLRPEMKLVVIEGATHGGARGALLRSEFIAAVREFIASNRKAKSR